MKSHTPYLALFLVSLLCSPLSAKEIPTTKPADVGMSAEKLDKVDEAMHALVKDNKLAGGVVMVARRGKIMHFQSYGLMDIEAKEPFRKDAIVRIYSMSKSITSAAALILHDEGKLKLDAPVSDYLPELKNLNVLGSDKPGRAMTVSDLMRHTSGLSYGFTGNTEVEKSYRKADVLNRDSSLSEMVMKLGKIPLRFEPGTDWQYSLSIDVLGRVVEVVSKTPLDEFMQKRIFGPLDMKDTGFYLPSDQLDRFATNYNSDRKGNLTLRDAPATSRYLKKPGLPSGGGGLVSTARDYMRFLMMVQSGGELLGTRVLSKDAMKLMTTNQLPKGVECIKFGQQIRHGVGFSLAFSVRFKDTKWDPQGRLGEYGWGGAASTHYWVSPNDDLIVVTLEQTMPYSFLTEFAVKGLIYDAIEK
jgi:CubicO group peptidase (beta-lactamase class C family)